MACVSSYRYLVRDRGFDGIQAPIFDVCLLVFPASLPLYLCMLLGVLL